LLPRCGEQLLPQDDGLTMSSVQIAQLTDTLHNHVMRDNRNMLET